MRPIAAQDGLGTLVPPGLGAGVSKLRRKS